MRNSKKIQVKNEQLDNIVSHKNSFHDSYSALSNHFYKKLSQISNDRKVNENFEENCLGIYAKKGPTFSESMGWVSGGDKGLRVLKNENFNNDDILEDLHNNLKIQKHKADRDYRYKVKHQISKRKLAYKRIHDCRSKPLFKNVELYKNLHFGSVSPVGLETCGSIWCCPVCRTEKLSEKQEYIEKGINKFKKDGGYVYLVTYTARHSKEDSLKDLLGTSKKDGISGAFSFLRKDGTWTRVKKKFGYKADCRVIEVTFGFINGWHVHIHKLIFVETELSEEQLKDFENDLYKIWERVSLRAGLKKPDRKHGVKVVPGIDAGKYIAKWSGASELTNGSAKLAKNGNFTISQIESLLLTDDESAMLEKQKEAILREFYRTFKGRHLLTWGGERDFRKKYFVKEESIKVISDINLGLSNVVGSINIIGHSNVCGFNIYTKKLYSGFEFTLSSSVNVSFHNLPLDVFIEKSKDDDYKIIGLCEGKLWSKLYWLGKIGTVLSVCELWGIEALKLYIRNILCLDDSGLTVYKEEARAGPIDTS